VKHTMAKGQRYVAHYDRAAKVKVEVEIAKLVVQRYIERRQQGAARGIIWNSASRNIISMSLDGDDIDKLYGALRYSQLVPIVFPRWRLRVYASSAALNASSSHHVLRILVKKLENSGVEVFRVRGLTAERVPPELWAYLVADDSEVERFVVRNSDTRPSDREAAALDDWLQTNWTVKPLYCIRDHPLHAAQPLVPGLVGGVPRLLTNATGSTFRKLVRRHKTVVGFLHETVWPLLKGQLVCAVNSTIFKHFAYLMADDYESISFKNGLKLLLAVLCSR